MLALPYSSCIRVQLLLLREHWSGTAFSSQSTRTGHVPLHKLLVLLLANPPDEARARKLLSHPVCRQSVLGEGEVEERGYIDAVYAELFLLLDEIGSAYEADRDFVPELGEELGHFGLDELGRDICQCGLANRGWIGAMGGECKWEKERYEYILVGA